MEKIFNWFNRRCVFIFFILIGFITFGAFIFAPLCRIFRVGSTRIIKKGKHYPTRKHFPFILSLHNIKHIHRTFVFTNSCLYDFDDNDEHDKNKLFGISFAMFPRIRTNEWVKQKHNNNSIVMAWFKLLGLSVIKPHHWSSARFCWNTINKHGKVNIYPYIYDEGIRVTLPLMGTCELDLHHKFRIEIMNGIVMFTMNGSAGENITTTHYIGNTGIFYYYLDLYFGGNKTAPHDIKIEEIN